MNFKQWILNEINQLNFKDWLKTKNYKSLRIDYENEEETNYSIITNLKDDSFIHFTLQDRAYQILKSKKLLNNAPYEKFLYPGVHAISLNFGYYVKDVQTKHIKEKATPENPMVAIVFKTKTMPDRGIGQQEEVNWTRDVPLMNPVIISANEAIKILKNNKPKMDKEYDMYAIQYV